jgi:hypothetical protein
MTRAQKQHAKEQRALLRLRKAAVRYSLLSDDPNHSGELALAFADLTAACDAYTAAIPGREARKLGALRLVGALNDLDRDDATQGERDQATETIAAMLGGAK